jgi:hypothetical protein
MLFQREKLYENFVKTQNFHTVTIISAVIFKTVLFALLHKHIYITAT